MAAATPPKKEPDPTRPDPTRPDPIRPEATAPGAAAPGAEPGAGAEAPEPTAEVVDADAPATSEVVTGEVVDDGADTAAAPDPRSPEELATALAEAERLRDVYLDQAQRGRAEYANLRRRSDEQLAAALDRGAERLITQLFGVLDNFGYVMDAIGDDDETQLAKGVRMVHAELFGMLEAAGLEPVQGVAAAFDPLVHEALLSEESDQPLEQPVVTEVLRRGYRFKGRTLRPASVKVAR